MIICIGPDGKVAETGPYKDLIARPDGVFNKLMEWQMSGGETAPRPSHSHGPTLTEEEEMAYRAVEGDEREGDEGVEQEGEKVRGENLTEGEAVLERVKDSRQ